MTVTISKRALRTENFRRKIYPFASARMGFAALLDALGLHNCGRVLLPSYIGYSPNEGSGVFDPVRNACTNCDFYRITNDLRIDLADLSRKLETPTELVVFIHYFGYPDPAIDQAAAIARQHGALVLEDEAHAFFSNWVTGLTGCWGDASIFSLHKMFPVSDGGLLQIRPTISDRVEARLSQNHSVRPLSFDINEYDLVAISRTRRANALRLQQLLEPLADHVTLLRSSLPDRVVPQTYPVLIKKQNRDNLYLDMNRMGYGCVSLYHTMIPEISETDYPESHHLAKTIFNLPIHQDVSLGDLAMMVDALKELCAP